jgi:hypothetical protein
LKPALANNSVRPYLENPFMKIELVEWFKVKALSLSPSTINKKKNHTKCPPHSVRMTIIKNTNNNFWQGCGEEHCWWECKLIQPLWETILRALRKLKMELSYDPAISILGI